MTTPSGPPRPGPLWGPYPENPRPWFSRSWVVRHAQPLLDRWPRPSDDAALLKDIRLRIALWQDVGEEGLQRRLHDLRGRLMRDGLTATLRIDALACVAEIARRRLEISAYDVQLLGAHIVITGGLAEMATGEGKTLTVALAAACCAMAGMPVHVLTANDYLAQRDASQFGTFYADLGLSTGLVTTDSDEATRRSAYGCDITYATAREVVFDYLRDRRQGGASGLRWHTDRLLGKGNSPILRGLCMAIIDEADSILIDEAQVPFVLSQSTPDTQEEDALRQALALARGLKDGVDYTMDPSSHTATLTSAGTDRLAKAAKWLDTPWRNVRHRESTVVRALVALHTLTEQRDYLRTDDGVHIIDPTTGRTSPGRAWSQGLHQLVELKEGLQPTRQTVPLASISFQRFFPRYARLSGLSGTLTEASAELRHTYGLNVRRVPLRRPSRRTLLPTRLFADAPALWEAVSKRVADIRARGQPVLVGTESVADSEALARMLAAHGIPHVVLNARHDGAEAAIVAAAGRPGQVTVATNMAGRGTDIALGAGVPQIGGLHVINCQLNEARRIDRQLLGRCARQGDPGSAETWLTLDNHLLRAHCPRHLLRWLARRTPLVAGFWILLLLRLLQHARERHGQLVRHRLFAQDEHMDRRLRLTDIT